MFKIAKIIKQLIKGYVEDDATDEFYFESLKKILPKQSVIKDQSKVTTPNDITEEFKMFKEQGYDFVATREVLQNRNQDTNQSPKSIHEHMKELSISGYLSNYSGDPQDVEKVMIQQELLIKEFMERVNERVEFVSVDNSELLVNTINDKAFTDVTKADLLGEY